MRRRGTCQDGISAATGLGPPHHIGSAYTLLLSEFGSTYCARSSWLRSSRPLPSARSGDSSSSTMGSRPYSFGEYGGFSEYGVYGAQCFW